MTKRREVTGGQIAEMTNWLCRLTPEEYQVRRGYLRRITDPKQKMDASLIYPFNNREPLENGLSVECEGALCETPIDILRLEAVPFHKNGEPYVSGDDMLRLVADEQKFPGCQGWGQHAAEHLFRRARELPKEWAVPGGPSLLFPDTILVNGVGLRFVPCLYWFYHDYDPRGKSWQLDYLRLKDGLNRRCHFIRLHK